MSLARIGFQVDGQHLVGSEYARHAGQNRSIAYLQRRILVAVHVRPAEVVRRFHFVRQDHGTEFQRLWAGRKRSAVEPALRAAITAPPSEEKYGCSLDKILGYYVGFDGGEAGR